MNREFLADFLFSIEKAVIVFGVILTGFVAGKIVLWVLY